MPSLFRYYLSNKCIPLFTVRNRLMTQLTNPRPFFRPCPFFSIVVVVCLSNWITNNCARAESLQNQIPTTQSSPELSTLKSWLDEQVSKSAVPGGSLLIVHRGQVVFREAFGVASPTTKKPFTIDAPVRIASITKPIVATGIIALAADGKISLDEPVSTWLPEFRNIQLTSGKPAKRAPNIRELLSHTGGVIADDAPQGRPWMKTWAQKTETTLEDVVKWAADQKLASEPGTEFAYSGCGFDTAVRAVEVACNVRFEDELEKRIFTPLGMHHSTFRPDRKLQAEIPPGFNLTKNGFVPMTRAPRDFNDKTYVTYGGTLVTIIDDLSKFMQFHLDTVSLTDNNWFPKKQSEKCIVNRRGRRKDMDLAGRWETLLRTAVESRSATQDQPARLAVWIFRSKATGSFSPKCPNRSPPNSLPIFSYSCGRKQRKCLRN